MELFEMAHLTQQQVQSGKAYLEFYAYRLSAWGVYCLPAAAAHGG